MDIYPKAVYPIKVAFGDRYIEFLLDGRRRISDLKPTLSLRPYTLTDGGFSQKRPLPDLKREI